ncbi:MAG: AraC family transcriptional regulator [Clostridium sp.]|nr:AraC family transcriptional regulator [Clostridium sp.]
MARYITCGELQHHLKNYYHTTGKKVQFVEMISFLYRRNNLSAAPPEAHEIEYNENMTDEEFERLVDSLVFTVDESAISTSQVKENDIIPTAKDVFVIRHPRYTRVFPHRHNYFEINYVLKGTCDFTFNDDVHKLKEGEVCIIAPESTHDMYVGDDESVVYTIMIRKSTFDTTFFSLLSQKNLLSYFFRNILHNKSKENFLILSSSDNKWLKIIIRVLMLESYGNDDYNNGCCINWVNLFFSNLLRTYSKTQQYYNYTVGSDFHLILQYIQKNYHTITLSELAANFHYSEPHMCNLIKQNTGYNFTDLIKQLRMADAVEYLINTNLRVNEIAEKVGYNSSDHFSRVFRSSYKMSPLQYRKDHKGSETSDFRPLSMLKNQHD